MDLAIGRTLADRLSGVLYQIEKNLDELVAIGEHRRQRGIVFLDELDMTREAGLGEPLHVLENAVNVDRLALDRPLVGEDFHAVDKLYDAIGLITDQPRERPVVIGGGLLEQLRGTANARQWILDLMRQHGGERSDRARRTAMRELAIHLV